MQLFTIGLVPLNLDGTPTASAAASNEETYDNEDIMVFARAWTGFLRQKPRANVETPTGSNTIDPLRIDPNRRDPFPKTNLYDGGFLGDGYPLCEDLPTRGFLRTGAKYRLLGSSSVPEMLWSDSDVTDSAATKRLQLQQGGDLYQLLCASDAVGGSCSFPSVVELDRDHLSYCTSNGGAESDECKVETVRVVQVDEFFYEYIQAPCVQLAFYDDGKKAVKGDNGNEGVCANPRLSVASEACCDSAELDQAVPSCIFSGERMTFDSAQERCASIGNSLCDARIFTPNEVCPHLGLRWTNEDCLVRVKIKADGYAAIVHELMDDDVLKHLRPDSPAYFRVHWDGEYPSVAKNNCGGGVCDQYEDTCICDISVAERPIFLSPPANAQEILSQLRVGHLGPSAFDGTTFTTQQAIDYRFHSPDEDGNCCDMDTVFQVTDRIGKTQFLRNVESTVTITGTDFAFRNPPHFNSFFVPYEASVSAAEYETEALLQHLFGHPNTAPFVATRFIQRFGVSNPSPRYVKLVASAFRGGIYTASDGTMFGIGQYGDMEAMVAAILLDREARSLALTGDPNHGWLMEPLLKVIGLLRSMEFEATTPLAELDLLDTKIGQMAFEQTSVFGFFSPDYSPPGQSQALVAPESGVMSSARVIGLLNGLLGLVRYGLVECRGGFGAFGECASSLSAQQPGGYLMYEPDDFVLSETVVKDLSTLLTSGRLSNDRSLAIRNRFDGETVSVLGHSTALSDPVLGMQLAIQLIVASPEFHTTSFSDTQLEPLVPPTDSGQPEQSLDYKAVVHLALVGGCDSFNLIVPHNSCGQLHQEYKDVRASVALGDDQVLPIGGDTTGQPCDRFGVHHKLPFLQSLYEDGDLLFLANTGVLTEPVDRDNFSDLTLARLFAHDAMVHFSGVARLLLFVSHTFHTCLCLFRVFPHFAARGGEYN